MSVLPLYELCLTSVYRSAATNTSLLHTTNLILLPSSCLCHLLVYFSPNELERLDEIYEQRSISTDDLWRRHFELIWSLSRDDRDAYESIADIPYKRLYFEYLFHDTQILQLGIYTHIQALNQSRSIVDVSYLDCLKYDLTRDSVIYCSKRRLTDEQRNLTLTWNKAWNKYIQRYSNDARRHGAPRLRYLHASDSSWCRTCGI